MQNFTDILNGVSDGTKDMTINALIANGTANLKGAVILGSSSSNDLTFNGSLASTIPIKTTNTYNIGSATLGLAGAYFGTGSTQTARIVAANSFASSRTYTMPDAGAAASFVMSAGTQTVTGITTFSAGAPILGVVTGSQPGTGYIGEFLSATGSANLSSAGTTNPKDACSLSLTAGIWLVWCGAEITGTSWISTGASVYLSTAADTLNTTAGWSQNLTYISSTFGDVILNTPVNIVATSGTPTYHCVCRSIFSSGASITGAGFIHALRIA